MVDFLVHKFYVTNVRFRVHIQISSSFDIDCVLVSVYFIHVSNPFFRYNLQIVDYNTYFVWMRLMFFMYASQKPLNIIERMNHVWTRVFGFSVLIFREIIRVK